MATTDGYKKKVDDEELLIAIEHGIQNSVGDFLNSSDMTRERLRATYEFAQLPQGEGLLPTGVSGIVDSSTTEVIEAYTAIISELFLSNNKIARFVPYDDSVSARMEAHKASDAVNYCIFKKNDGWRILSNWIKSALLWKNSILTWEYVEDYDYMFQEYEELSQAKLDEMLSDPNVELVGELEISPTTTIDEETGEAISEMVYTDVRLRKQIDKSRVDIKMVPPENFRITRDATCIEDADFVGLQYEMTRSDIRKNWPSAADYIDDNNVWDELGDVYQLNTHYTEERAARKEITGQEYWQGSNEQTILPTEANREVSVVVSWLRVDRDGDGIAELKRFVSSGDHILMEEDVDYINLASLCPIEIPHEFFGLSMADFVRSTTLANTAIIRGFLENVYLTNFAPKMADPNVVDFGALQNMRPKQLIPTNGNPTGAVVPLPPETISPGTTGILEFLQVHKEQATGMSKAAQGLNDALYVSGNSEQKVQAVQTASQKRIQHIARTFAETGFKRLVEGVYHCMRMNGMKMSGYNAMSEYFDINFDDLPDRMEVEVAARVGDHADGNMISKLQSVQGLIDGLQAAGAGMVIKQEAPVVIAEMAFNALDIDPSKVIEDWQDPEFAEVIAKAIEQQEAQAAEQAEIEKRNIEAETAKREAEVEYTMAQAKNTLQDNIRQTAIAMDKHLQEWEKLNQDAMDNEVNPPTKPDIMQIFVAAQEAVNQMEPSSGDPMEQIMEIVQDNPEVLQQLLQMIGGQNG